MSLTTGRLALIPAIALLAIATLGCQGGGDDKATDDTARQISDDELAGMALSLTDFGAEYADFVANGDNGPRTIDEIAEDDFDPEDERADMERAGWSSGYQEFYISPPDAEEESSVFFVGSSIDLFETAEGAADYLDDSRAELTTQIGKKGDNGFTLQNTREFDADVADEAAGAVFEGSIETEQISSTSYWLTAVMFRHGRLVAVVGMYSSEEPQLEDTVRALALQFDQKIESALGASAAAR
jgi:hypothetical protein